jgi:hypothetical protein
MILAGIKIQNSYLGGPLSRRRPRTLCPSQETNGAKAVFMDNVWAISGTQDEPNASMDRRSQFSHARRAADLGCRDYDRSDWLGYD